MSRDGSVIVLAMERPQVKTEETEEIFTSVIDIEEHEVKSEHEELDSVGNELLPFEEILTSEVASEERAVDVKMEEDPLNLWPTRYPVMTVSEDPPVRRKRKKKNCDDCGVKHKRPTLMVWHDSTCHGPDACVKVNKISDTKLEYQCVWCEVANKDPLRITHHLRHAHNIDKYLQHCSNCGKGFIFENEQKKHQQKCEEMKVQVKRSAIPQELNVFSKQSNLQCKVPSIPLKINNFTPKNQSESSNCTSNKGLLASNVPSIPLKINSITPKNNSESSICTSIRSTLSSQAPNNLLPASGKSNKCKIANYICDECAIGFFDWQMLSWHVKNFHGPNAIVNVIKNGVNKPNYLCTRCKNLYRDILSLMHHLNMKHGFSDLPFKCSVCTKSFELEMQLQNHECKNTEHNVTSYPLVSCNQQGSSDIGYNTNCPIPIRPGENLSAGAKISSDFNTRENMKIDVFVKKVPQSYPTSSKLQYNRVHNNLFQTPMQTLVNMKADFSVSGAQHNNASNNLSRVDNELTNAPILIPSSSPENVKANVSGAQQSFSVAVRKQNRVANAVANTPLLTPRDNNMKANDSVNGVQYSNATSNQSTVVNVLTNTPLLKPIENLKANVSGDPDSVNNCTTNQSKKSNDVANTAHLTLIENMKANLSRALQSESNCINNPSIVANVKTELLKCDQCDIIYDDAKLLIKHIENCHGPDAFIRVIKTPKLFQCAICRTKFRELHQLIPHLREQHEYDKTLHSCNGCDSKLLLKSDLLRYKVNCMSEKIGLGYTETPKIDTKVKPAENKLDYIHQRADAPLKECRVLLHRLLEFAPCKFYTDNKTQLETHLQAHSVPKTSDNLIQNTSERL